MKIWYVTEMHSKLMYTCSLVEMTAKTNSCILKGDCGRLFIIFFTTQPKYQFAMAKIGKVVVARTRSRKTNELIRVGIIFR